MAARSATRAASRRCSASRAAARRASSSRSRSAAASAPAPASAASCAPDRAPRGARAVRRVGAPGPRCRRRARRAARPVGPRRPRPRGGRALRRGRGPFADLPGEGRESASSSVDVGLLLAGVEPGRAGDRLGFGGSRERRQCLARRVDRSAQLLRALRCGEFRPIVRDGIGLRLERGEGRARPLPALLLLALGEEFGVLLLGGGVRRGRGRLFGGGRLDDVPGAERPLLHAGEPGAEVESPASGSTLSADASSEFRDAESRRSASPPARGGRRGPCSRGRGPRSASLRRCSNARSYSSKRRVPKRVRRSAWRSSFFASRKRANLFCASRITCRNCCWLSPRISSRSTPTSRGAPPGPPTCRRPTRTCAPRAPGSSCPRRGA